MRAIIRIATEVDAKEEDETYKKELWHAIPIAGVPHVGDFVFLPTPSGYGTLEFRVKSVSFLQNHVVLAGGLWNHFLDQEMYDDMIEIGYEEKSTYFELLVLMLNHKRKGDD